MQSSTLGTLSNSLAEHMAHQVIFLVLLNFSSHSHLPSLPSFLSCTIYVLSLCLPVPGIIMSLYLLIAEKMLLVCHVVLRGADITNTSCLACCKLAPDFGESLLCVLF